ncbi:unnamed protein product [Trichobilharzia szidati]|nr:unnamed protein product [Trichobilharzia szidati]
MLTTLMTNSQVQDYLFPTVGSGITPTITTITGETSGIATGTTTTTTSTTPFPPTTSSSTSTKSSLIIASTLLSSPLSKESDDNNSSLLHCSMKSPQENLINHYDNHHHCNELLLLLSSSSPPPNSMKSFDTRSFNAYDDEDENDIDEVRIFHDDNDDEANANITTDQETSSCGAVKEISLNAGRKDSPIPRSPTIDSSCLLLSSSLSSSSVLLTPLHISKESFTPGILCYEQQEKKEEEGDEEEEKSCEVNGIYCPTTSESSTQSSLSISTVSLQHQHHLQEQQQHTQNHRQHHHSLTENYYYTTTPQQDSCQNQFIQREDKSINQEITTALTSNDCNRIISLKNDQNQNQSKVATHKQGNLKQNSINNDHGKQSWNNNDVVYKKRASDKHQVAKTAKNNNDEIINCGDENSQRRKTLRKQQSHCRSMSSPKICKRTEVIRSGTTHGVGDGVQDGTTDSLCRVNNNFKILHTSTYNSIGQPQRTKTPVSSCCSNNEQKPEQKNSSSSLLLSSSLSSSFMKDRRAISKAADEKRCAIKQAHLLASEEAVILARHKASERREAKLMEIRQRLKVRHEQVEARRRAIEMAEQVR